jgi:hypothetical protein
MGEGKDASGSSGPLFISFVVFSRSTETIFDGLNKSSLMSHEPLNISDACTR